MKVLDRIFVVAIILGILGMGVTVFIKAKPRTYDPPTAGFWKSTNPDIIFYIDENPENRPFEGTYLKDGVQEPILVSFGGTQPAMEICPESAYDRPRNRWDGNQTWFSGSFNVAEDGQTFTYSLLPHWRKETGYKKIVFEKVEIEE